MACTIGMPEDPPLAQRRPALRGDPHLRMLGAQLPLRQLGMQLDLVQRRHHARLAHDPVQMLGRKFDTPIEVARPSSRSRTSAFQVST
jgi:hypothetical protein